MTQTALLLCHDSAFISPEQISRQLKIFETSSPSYVLLASIARCVNFLEEEEKTKYNNRFSDFADTLRVMYTKLKKLRKLQHITYSKRFFDFDRSKIIISTRKASITGFQLADAMRMRGYELEAQSDNHILALTSVADDMRALFAFCDDLIDIDNHVKTGQKPFFVILSPGIDI